MMPPILLSYLFLVAVGTATIHLAQSISAYRSKLFLYTEHGDLLSEEATMTSIIEHLIIQSTSNYFDGPTDCPKHHVTILLTSLLLITKREESKFKFDGEETYDDATDQCSLHITILLATLQEESKFTFYGLVKIATYDDASDDQREKEESKFIFYGLETYCDATDQCSSLHIAILLISLHEESGSQFNGQDTVSSIATYDDATDHISLEDRSDVSEVNQNIEMLICLIQYLLYLIYRNLRMRCDTHKIDKHLNNGTHWSVEQINTNMIIGKTINSSTQVEMEVHQDAHLADKTCQEKTIPSRRSKKNRKKRNKSEPKDIQAECIDNGTTTIPPGQFETLLRHLPNAALMEREMAITARVLALLEEGLTQSSYPHQNEKLLSFYTPTFRLAQDENCHVLLTVLNRNLDLMKKGFEYHRAWKLASVDLKRIDEFRPAIEADINNTFSFCTANTDPARKNTVGQHTLETMTIIKREIFSLLALLKFLRQRAINMKYLSLDLHNMPVDYAWTIAKQAILMLRAGDTLELVSGLGVESRKRWYTRSGTIREDFNEKFKSFNKQHGNKFVNLGHPKSDGDNIRNRGCFHVWYRDV